MIHKLLFKSVKWMEKYRNNWWLEREDVFLHDVERNNYFEEKEHSEK